MNLSQAERVGLAQALMDAGPDAPTLCGEWTTRDLAAHLYVRENRPGASLISALPLGGDPVEKEFSQAHQRPFEDVVNDWSQGPKGLNPWRVLDSVGNGLEHFIHHEDVRRGALHPGDAIEERFLDPEHERSLYKALKLIAHRVLKSSRPIVLHPRGFPRIVCNDKPGVSKDGQAVLRIDGGVGELVLWLSGRDVVQLKFSDDPSMVTRMSL